MARSLLPLLLAAAATSTYAAPATLHPRLDPQCSLVSSLRVIDSSTGFITLDLYDNSGVHQGYSVGMEVNVDSTLGKLEGLEQPLWSSTLRGADGSNNGGIMDIEFVYGPSADLQPFHWLDCGVKTPLDSEGTEVRQCWFACSGYVV